MGVTGLWTVVSPTARPTQLATLHRKRLAVDASIWIYQFLKAVRDKDGNALRNSHVVGFFRRICKLLYFGIKPVFVFDGGAPVLKRETVRGRVRRREGRREDAVRTAGKLLAVQLARAAEEENQRSKAPDEEEVPEGEELVYVDEIGMNAQERRVGRGFKRKDQYHLPDLDVELSNMGAPNDPRIMSQTELEEYAAQFHSGEDVGLYDFSKIDFESVFFLSLPMGDRYNILNAARLRSRLRMGYSKEQLDGMFPDRMAFSRFQIERVKERNELTQRLMHVNNGGVAEDGWDQGGRIAGEKGREYVLVKNDGVEGGWALGVVSNKQGGKREDAIDLEEGAKEEDDEGGEDDEDEFEDVAIEGLNRIPKVWQRKKGKEADEDARYDAAEEIARKRSEVYESRRMAARKPAGRPEERPLLNEDDDDGLFIRQDGDGVDQEEDDLFEDVDMTLNENEDDDDLRLAIAMSLEPDKMTDQATSGGFLIAESDGRQMAHQINAVAGRSTTNQVDDEDDMDLQAALAESRKSKYPAKTAIRDRPTFQAPEPSRFDGPLPFESINLGRSMLSKKKKPTGDGPSGGFDRQSGEDAFRKQKPAQPLPAWFNAAPSTKDLRTAGDEREYDSDDHITAGRDDVSRREMLQRAATKEVIDLDAIDETGKVTEGAYLPDDDYDDVPDDKSTGNEEGAGLILSQDKTLPAEAEAGDELQLSTREEHIKQQEEKERQQRYKLAQAIAAENEDEVPTMKDIADHAQAKPPSSDIPVFIPDEAPGDQDEDAEEKEGDSIAWSESDVDVEGDRHVEKTPATGRTDDTLAEDDEGQDFEDVQSLPPTDQPSLPHEDSTLNAHDIAMTSQYILADHDDHDADTAAPNNQGPDNDADEHYFSDSDEELMRQLAIEAEEHARFASSLNATKTPAEAARDYETELKQLRNQQKKDRRDADEVTQTMVQECQALLQLFGLPYITAPMEAEAQCAELVRLGLVDGIVTDDSDIFLFGGTRIYKNMFNAAKFVECYLTTDLEKEYALDRRKLIRFAHLLGSDYTEGVPGIGPVSALEILTDFATLEDFKEWCSKVQLGRPQDLEDQLNTPFRRKFRNAVQKRLFLPPGFPDLRVDHAYLHPDVDSDPQEFQWGVPDLDKLRGFLMATIGWSQERTDEILVPVIRDMNKRETEGTQANITRFFAGGMGVGVAAKEGNAPRNRSGKESGRMAKAFSRLRTEAERRRRSNQDEEENDINVRHDDAETEADEEEFQGQSMPRFKTTARRRKGTTKQAARGQGEDDEVDEDADASDIAPQRTKKRRKKKAVQDG